MTNHQPLFKNLRRITDEVDHSIIATRYTDDDIREIVATLREAIEKSKAVVASEGQPEAQTEVESVSSKAQKALHDAERILQVTGIALPRNRTELYVKATTVQQLQEYHQDGSLLLLLASLSAGATLGVLANWAVADIPTLSKAGWIALILFGITAFVFAGLYRRTQRKIREINERIEADK